MTANQSKIAVYAETLQLLVSEHKKELARTISDAEADDLDGPSLRRFVAWKAKDHAKLADQRAIDDQCQFLAGERETAGVPPHGGQLDEALTRYRRGLTVRQVADDLGVSVGKAAKYRTFAKMFGVQLAVNAGKNEQAPTPAADDHAPVRAAAGKKMTGDITVPPIEKVKKGKAAKETPAAEPLPAHDAETGEGMLNAAGQAMTDAFTAPLVEAAQRILDEEIMPTVGQVAPPPLPEPPDNSDIFDPEPGPVPGKVLHPEEVNGLLDGAGVSPQERQEMAKLTQLKAPLVPKLTPEELEAEMAASRKRAMDRIAGKAQAAEQAEDDLAIPEFLRRPKS